MVVSAAGSTTIVDSRTQAEKAMHLPSVHGSLTYMESDIPCLIDVASIERSERLNGCCRGMLGNVNQSPNRISSQLGTAERPARRFDLVVL